MLLNVFSYKVYKTSLNFSYKKELINIINNSESDILKLYNEKTTTAKIFSFFQNDNRFKINNVNILNKLSLEIERKLFLFSKELNLNRELSISNFWCVSYYKDQKCFPHTHDNNKDYVFSGIYYLSFDKNEHLGTRFYENESLEKSKVVSCEEDDIIIYPADIFHGYDGTSSKKMRIVLPFDICYKNSKKQINYF